MVVLMIIGDGCDSGGIGDDGSYISGRGIY